MRLLESDHVVIFKESIRIITCRGRTEVAFRMCLLIQNDMGFNLICFFHFLLCVMLYMKIHLAVIILSYVCFDIPVSR